MANVLITGANRGIGLELAKQLQRRGDSVIAVCRRSSAALDALGVRVEKDVDVTDDASLRALVERLGDVSLDVVVLNAGVLERTSLPDIDFDSVQKQIAVNAIGPLRCTTALLSHFAKGSKLALITSRMGSIEDNGSGGSYGYRMSKAALNAAGKSLAIDLASKDIAVAILHPGWVRTSMTDNTGNVDASEAASMLIARIDALSPETSGTFWHANGEVLPW